MMGNSGHTRANGSLKTEGEIEPLAWTVKVAAAKACRTEKAMRHLIARGVIRAWKAGGRIYVSPEEVTAKLLRGDFDVS